MKIDFDTLIKDSGQKITKRQLAREMTDQGLFRNRESAERMIHYHQSGKAKSVDYAMLQFLIDRFAKSWNQIIEI